MVMRSFKMGRLSKEVGERKAKEFKAEILRRFSGRIEVRIEGEEIVIEGDGLSDYRTFDAITYIITEGKHGKDL